MSQRGNQQKITVATSEEEARKLLATYDDYLIVNDAVKQTAVNIATSKEQGGIEEAKRFLGNTLAQERARVNTDARRQQVDPILISNTNTFTNALAERIFKAAASGYVSLSPNVTVAEAHNRDDIQQALNEWRMYLGDGVLNQNIMNVHVYDLQNKAVAGRGNVGDTLATRTWQANVISTWFGRVINVHIDLA